MKTNKMLLFIPFVALVLTSCDPSSFRFKYNELNGDVVKVELINYENNNQKHYATWVPDYYNDLLRFENDNATTLKILEDDLVDSFIRQLCSYRLLYRYYAFNSPKGECIKMTHSNNDFTIIWCKTNSYSGYIGKYSSSGEVVDFYGCFESWDSYNSLLITYFIEIE